MMTAKNRPLRAHTAALHYLAFAPLLLLLVPVSPTFAQGPEQYTS